MSMDTRPDWDHYFMEIARVVSKRSTCLRRSVGAVIVKNRQIVATGYNGTPSRLEHCAVTGCLREQLKVPSGKMHELCRGIHAEQKILINAGIKRIVYANPYPDKLAEEMLKASKMEITILDGETKKKINVKT